MPVARSARAARAPRACALSLWAAGAGVSSSRDGARVPRRAGAQRASPKRRAGARSASTDWLARERYLLLCVCLASRGAARAQLARRRRRRRSHRALAVRRRRLRPLRGAPASTSASAGHSARPTGGDSRESELASGAEAIGGVARRGGARGAWQERSGRRPRSAPMPAARCAGSSSICCGRSGSSRRASRSHPAA